MSVIGGIMDTKNHIYPLEITTMSDAAHNIHCDRSGEWVSEHVGMYCKLLWTTPESKHERLPLQDLVSCCTLTADARIDNRKELIILLEIEVEPTTPLSDGELILKSYLKWGERCVDHLIGDFAFVIWDESLQKLFCARDHLGIKPLYYHFDNYRFTFSSTMASVISGSNLTKKPNVKVLKEILDRNIQNFTETVFEQVTRLLPAHTLVVEKGEIRIQRYWFPETIPMNRNISLKDASCSFEKIMKRSISDRMRSDYPIGCELSGGLDSSTILSLSHEIPSDQPLYPFSSIYGDLPCDESEYIADVAQKLGVEPVYSHADQLNYSHYNLNLFYSISKEWPGQGSFLDSFAEYESAQALGVRVILSGQGGDHVATGDYDMLTDYMVWGKFIHLYKALKHLKWKKNLIKRYLILPFLPKKVVTFLKRLLGKPIAILYSNLYSLDPNASFFSFSQKNELELLYGPAQLMWLDLNIYVQIAEYYGIEYRHPFFDKRVVEYMLSLPPWHKYDGDLTKIIIRSAMHERFPSSVFRRNDKAEFTPIIERQITDHTPPELKIMEKYGIIKKEEIPNVLYSNDVDKKWRIMCVGYWLNINFENEGI